MNAYWFRPKRYGYGATPVTWQGWAVTVASVIAIAGVSLLTVRHNPHSPTAWFALFALEALIVALLVVVCRRKTDGAWRWRWGDR